MLRDQEFYISDTYIPTNQFLLIMSILVTLPFIIPYIIEWIYQFTTILLQ